MERRPRSGADDRDHQPGGFEGFFRELSDLVAAGPPSPHARLEIAERYRLEFAEPSWLPDIIERYNLTPLPADRTRRAPGGECPHVVLTATCGGSVLAASKDLQCAVLGLFPRANPLATASTLQLWVLRRKQDFLDVRSRRYDAPECLGRGRTAAVSDSQP